MHVTNITNVKREVVKPVPHHTTQPLGPYSGDHVKIFTARYILLPVKLTRRDMLFSTRSDNVLRLSLENSAVVAWSRGTTNSKPASMEFPIFNACPAIRLARARLMEISISSVSFRNVCSAKCVKLF